MESQIQGRIRTGVIALVMSMFGFLAVIVGVLALVSQSDAMKQIVKPEFIGYGIIVLAIISVVGLFISRHK